MKLSAGLLLYRTTGGVREVFLVHPGGPFWAKKDAGSWSAPKGEYQEDEDPLAAARREFQEETGHMAPEGEPKLLGEVKYGNKRVSVYTYEADAIFDPIRSNTITIEWPPRSGGSLEIPEVDRAGWFSFSIASKKLVKGQVPLIAMLAHKLGEPLDTGESEPAHEQLPLL